MTEVFDWIKNEGVPRLLGGKEVDELMQDDGKCIGRALGRLDKISFCVLQKHNSLGCFWLILT